MYSETQPQTDDADLAHRDFARRLASLLADVAMNPDPDDTEGDDPEPEATPA